MTLLQVVDRAVTPMRCRTRRALLGWAKTAFDAPDPRRLILWAPVAIGAGAAAYFALRSEPPPQTPGLAVVIAILITVLAARMHRHPRGLVALILLALTLTGFALAQWHAQSFASGADHGRERAHVLEGWIERVERSGTRERLILRVTDMEGSETPPHRVRIRTRLGELEPGDLVRVNAVLAPPGGPAAPGGYDPARAAWFDAIGLTGFAIAPPEAILSGETSDRAVRDFVRWRWRLAERIRDMGGEDTGGLAAALLTGDRSGVSQAQADALRVSGLGHILAISGLHMALVAGGIYFAARFAFAAIVPFARAYDPRKPAALIALTAALAYLVVSGASVSTQRAFIMTAVVLFGVMLDRRAFSFRSLSLAALIILVMAPESVIEPGFQMSFAAVAALIAVFDLWTRLRRAPMQPPGWVARAWNGFAGLAATSLVAGMATGAFAAFHFQRLAAYGFLANLAAMPVFTFWVMPWGVASLLLMPVGLEAGPLALMDAGLRVVMWVANAAATREGAAIAVSAAPGLTVALYGLGFALLTIGRGAVRPAGAVLIAAGFSVWSSATAPDMLITESGAAIARYAPENPDAEGEDRQWQTNDRRRGRFDARVFLQRVGETNTAPAGADLRCDALGCTGQTVDGLVLAFPNSAQALEDDCARADIIVIDVTVSPWLTRRCAAFVFDSRERSRLGSTEFWIRDGQVIRFQGANTARGLRPWTPRPDG
ncbi:ComEC/Rec2 family competence protein [Marinicauda sp. Alg238-R41]|uniref:ComEC/Rec2 family competence protein n=1 Tax=Marinicauda sp. Alg238-R41 TaxID=2993447 RepID=UPI0022E11827|nr:ComEC/Rec2 family competence protein [Marinicauda sp. Alg238-R41]